MTGAARRSLLRHQRDVRSRAARTALTLAVILVSLGCGSRTEPGFAYPPDGTIPEAQEFLATNFAAECAFGVLTVYDDGGFSYVHISDCPRWGLPTACGPQPAFLAQDNETNRWVVLQLLDPETLEATQLLTFDHQLDSACLDAASAYLFAGLENRKVNLASGTELQVQTESPDPEEGFWAGRCFLGPGWVLHVVWVARFDGRGPGWLAAHDTLNMTGMDLSPSESSTLLLSLGEASTPTVTPDHRIDYLSVGPDGPVLSSLDLSNFEVHEQPTDVQPGTGALYWVADGLWAYFGRDHGATFVFGLNAAGASWPIAEYHQPQEAIWVAPVFGRWVVVTGLDEDDTTWVEILDIDTGAVSPQGRTIYSRSDAPVALAPIER